MHVEDHPMEYAKFEGTIPKGNYGAGTVMVWDIGTYTTMEENAIAAYHSGKLHLYMKGKKLNGEWVLVRTGKEDPRQWLLMKAGAKMAPISVKKDDQSALTGRTMKKIAEDNDAQWISNRPPSEDKHKRRFAQRVAEDPIAKFSSILKGLPSGKPRYVEPMQSKPVTSLPDGKAWVYEVKFDGYRALGIRQGSKIRLISRSNKDLSRQYPEIVESLTSLPDKDWVVDGEIVALNEKGVPSFQLLQNIGSAKEDRPLHYFSFDLIHLNGKDLIGLPLFQRKQILEAILESSDGRILFSANIEGDPEILLKEVRKRGLEGVVAKRKESKYEPGKRSGAWQKFKAEAGQEFVIGGFKPSSRSNSLDSILAGYYKGKKLMYAGSVRAGFTPHTRVEVFSRIKDLVDPKCPFSNLPEEEKGRWGEGLTEEDMEKCIWVKPRVVVRIDFTEWTGANHLRHAKFAGIVEDKKATDVIKES
jgi:bifunctional non-homologous end joining protein LigD